MKVKIHRVLGCEVDIASFARKTYGGGLSTPERDKRLIESLRVREHGTPFDVASIIWDITAPRDVADQLLRYRHSTPNVMTLRACAPPSVEECEPSERAWYKKCYDEYERRIDVGYSREDARKCLPLSTPTKFFWLTNIRELQKIFVQRISHDAQRDTRQLVEEMHRKAIAMFPNCFYSVVYECDPLE
jgi:thymidylate synthase (FAD)